jgi:hypothetical protein
LRLIGPLLLGSDQATSTAEKETPWRRLPPHRDEEQVQLDVNRSFVYYPLGESEKQLDVRRVELQALIVETLRRHPSLCYFQGYHDIVQVFLLVQGAGPAPALVRRLSMLRIRDFMLPKLSASVSHLQLLPAILYKADRAIYDILPANPFYGLAHVLTLYSHDIQSYKDIARLFDFLLAREAVMSIYLFAVIVISRREQLLEYMVDGPDEDVMSVVLQKLPQDLDLEATITQAIHLFENHPPKSLPFKTWRRISENSVLKTTMATESVTTQTLAQGQIWFDRQAEEIQRQEARAKMVHIVKKSMYKYQRPAVLTISVAVCVFALWFNRDRGSVFGGILQRLWNTSNLGRFMGLAGAHREL